MTEHHTFATTTTTNTTDTATTPTGKGAMPWGVGRVLISRTLTFEPVGG